MIETLQTIFPSCTYSNDAKSVTTAAYQWFITKENEMIGIRKDELMNRDLTLLSAFLTPYHVKLPAMSRNEQLWTKLVHNGDIPATMHHVNNYRFVYFSFPINQLDPSAFKEAIQAIFTSEIAILWENDHTGIIVEIDDKGLSYEQIVDVLMSDLYVKIKFYVGEYHKDLQQAKSYYNRLLNDAPAAFSYTKDNVISYMYAIPYLIVDQADHTFLQMLAETVLKDILQDAEILETIEAFIQHNLNISVTAKVLYMHRNSLQYRIDKFIEKTGIDIRQFQAAMTVKLALLAKKHLDL
ncbi:helix-turn-helix domain-containing protein [Lentibacillus sp. N15]|uniref:PucR family transcriptional regulator n=1 Tax=Lentibacillus songyuanensis TaxID=3136161 RepID=UPI0031BABC35